MTKEDDARRLRDLKVTATWLRIALLVGLLVVALRYLPGYLWRGQNIWTVTGETLVSLLWSLGWTAAGFLVGFLFGIPKVIQGGQNATAGGQSGTGTSSSVQVVNLPYQMRVNTNLEEISDWLTKLIVGATLTQLVKIPGYISAAAHFMASGVGGSGAPFAAAILVYFSSVGFLCGYILTRLFLSGAFALADRFGQSTVDVVDSGSLPGSEDGPNAPAVQKVTAELATVPISEALTVDEANTLARSALIEKDPARALRAASIATGKDPKDAQAQLNYAVALSLVNSASPLVLARLKSACDLMPSDLDPESREDMFNTLVYTALYQDPPQGYEAAIQYGEKFTKASKPKKASIWINLACAYGQQYAWLKRQTILDTTTSSGAVNNAIQAIQQALAIEPATKTRFQQLADPTNHDNDLSDLANDNTQVQALLGLTPSSASQASPPAATPAEPSDDPKGQS